MTTRHLGAALGQPGAGRLRYGAAMALHAEGRIGDAVLEVYRICSAHDHADPEAMLAARGLAAPEMPQADPAADIRDLVAAADRHLCRLPGPGVAEVRAGLAATGGQASPRTAPLPALVATHLPVALAALDLTHPALAGAIAAAAPHLGWTRYDAYGAGIGPDFPRLHAYASLIGAGAPIPAEDFDFGLFLIAPHVLYRDHHHAAPELYVPLTGPHGWRFGPDRPLIRKAAHVPVWNPPHRPHLTKVGPLPFLSLFCWTRDVDAPATVIAANDWPRLEALRLEADADP